MDIFAYAMKMEKDGETFYRQLAGKTENKGLKNILTMLADAEVIHYKIFQHMKENKKVKITSTKILSKVKNVFEKIREEADTGGVDVSQVRSYKKAQEIEKKSRDFYLEKAGETKSKSQKEIFLKIADEEKKHYFILEKIIEFVSKPETWLEDAEWYHIEEY